MQNMMLMGEGGGKGKQKQLASAPEPDQEDYSDEEAGPDEVGQAALDARPAAEPAQRPNPYTQAKLMGYAPGPMASRPAPAAPKGEDSEDDSPKPSSRGGDIPMVTEEDLKSARDEKRRLATIGALGDALANQQSWGNFFLGKMNPHQDVSGAMAKKAALVDQDVKDKQALQAQAMKAPEMQYVKDLQDPTSDASVAKKESLKAAYMGLARAGAIDPEKVQDLVAKVDGMTGFQADKMLSGSPLLKQAGDMYARQAQLAIAGRRLEISEGNQALAAGKMVGGDPNLNTLVKQSQAIDRGLHTIQGVKTLTPQLLSEVQLDIANAISGGKAAAVSTQEKVEFESLNTKWANLMQKINNRPEDINSPEVKQYMVDVMSRLKDAYARNMDERKRQVGAGMEAIDNPRAQKMVRDKLATYGTQPDEGRAPGFGMAGDVMAGGVSDEDRQALEWAKNNPGDPRAFKVLLKLQEKKGGR